MGNQQPTFDCREGISQFLRHVFPKRPLVACQIFVFDTLNILGKFQGFCWSLSSKWVVEIGLFFFFAFSDSVVAPDKSQRLTQNSCSLIQCSSFLGLLTQLICSSFGYQVNGDAQRERHACWQHHLAQKLLNVLKIDLSLMISSCPCHICMSPFCWCCCLFMALRWHFFMIFSPPFFSTLLHAFRKH